ncbi:MAG: restriction endonuclease subunit S [Curvibacter sp.]|nr:MAG: restriction endonuclease subunit S [Curvibacter sp.]
MSWPVVPLAKALDSAHVFVDGDWVESKDQDPDGDVRLIQLADIGDGYYVDKSNRFLTSDAARRLKCTFLEAGDLLIARMPDPLGRACIFPGDSKRAVTVVDVCIIRPDSNTVYTSWLMHCINSPQSRNQIDEYTTGTTRQRISRGNLTKIKVALPPLEEQRRIAAILDQAETLRTQRRQALAHLDTLTQSLFLDMFGDPVANPRRWVTRSLDEVTLKVTDGEHLNPVFSESGMPIVMAGNVLVDQIDLDSAKRVESSLGQQFRKKCGPELGDLLIVGRGATIGRLCRVSVSDTFCLMGSVILVKPDRSLLDERFLSGMLALPSMHAMLYKSSGSSAQQAIYLKDVKRLVCPLPPLPLQQTFATRIQAIEALKVTHRTALAQLDALFASLQQRAFAGEL